MILWRISNHATLDGGDGLRASGRWHSRGRRVVYCAENPAAALLDVLVHLEIDVEDVPAGFQLLEIEVADGASEERVEPGELSEDWVERNAVTRAVGDRWLADGAAALLRVPSVIVPETENVLLNPGHRDAGRVRVSRVWRWPWDLQLLK